MMKKVLLATAVMLLVAYAIPLSVSLSARRHATFFYGLAGIVRTYDSNLLSDALTEAGFGDAIGLYNGGINGLSLLPDNLLIRRVEITAANGPAAICYTYRQYTYFNIPVGTRNKCGA